MFVADIHGKFFRVAPGSAGLQPGLEATLERGAPRRRPKHSCGDALGKGAQIWDNTAAAGHSESFILLRALFILL